MRRLFFGFCMALIWAPRADAQDSLQGVWTAQQREEGFWISLSVDDRSWQHSSFLQLPGLPNDKFVLEIDREPGKITLEGLREGQRAAGFFTFRSKREFNRQIGGLGYGPFDFNQLYVLTAIDARTSEISRLPGLGYADLTTDELFAMHIHDALGDHISDLQALGFTNLTVDDLLATRIHDVDAGFVRAVRALGLETRSIDELVSMRIHDVTPEYIESIRALGYPDVTADEFISMRIHDVTPEYIRAMNEKLVLARD